MASLNDMLYDIRRTAEHREKLTDAKIKKIYQSLSDDLTAFVGKQYAKYSDDDGRLYVSYLDAQNARAKFLREIVENVDNITPDVQSEIVRLVNETYEKSYKGMSEALLKADTAAKFEDLAKGIDVNPDVLRQAVNNNVSKLTLPAVLEKHRNEIIYQIQQELNIGLMQGDRYKKMASRISERIGVAESKAKNIVRTESHRNVESGFMDCAERIQESMEGSEYIYAATWRTMNDERVRPQQRRKTKKGWKTTYSKNGANHMKMEAVTVKAGEMFDLGNGVKAKAPSQSGVAAHDCQCRCFLEYNLMTVEEFAKAARMTEEQVRKKYNMAVDEIVELQISDFPQEFTKGAEGKNTQKLIDYINSIDGADKNVLKLYARTGKLENISSNGITFKISHAKGSSVGVTSDRVTGDILEVKYTIPKLKGDNISGQVNTTLHEQMHLIDLYGRQDTKKNSDWFSVQNKNLSNTIKKTSASMSEDVEMLFKLYNSECKKINTDLSNEFYRLNSELRAKYGLTTYENLSAYKQYKKDYDKLRKQFNERLDYERRNAMGGGVGNLQDIYDALSGGTYRADGTVLYGHGQHYYAFQRNRTVETIANYASLSVTRPDLIDMLKKDKPELCKALDEVVLGLIEKAGG